MSDVGPSTPENGRAPFVLGLIARNCPFDPFSVATQPPFGGAAKSAPSSSIFIRDTCTSGSRASLDDSRVPQKGAA